MKEIKKEIKKEMGVFEKALNRFLSKDGFFSQTERNKNVKSIKGKKKKERSRLCWR